MARVADELKAKAAIAIPIALVSVFNKLIRRFVPSIVGLTGGPFSIVSVPAPPPPAILLGAFVALVVQYHLVALGSLFCIDSTLFPARNALDKAEIGRSFCLSEQKFFLFVSFRPSLHSYTLNFNGQTTPIKLLYVFSHVWNPSWATRRLLRPLKSVHFHLTYFASPATSFA